MKRFPFLDWMRGLAVVFMIQCHTFNSFTRMDVREGGTYVLTQFVGGMAAPLFLFMAGMTLAFQMDSLDRKVPSAFRRWAISLRRAAYVLAIAFAIRIVNYLGSIPHADWHEITKVDILNCMGVALMAISVAAAFDFSSRVRFALAVGLLIAAASPLIADLPWDKAPALLREYIAPPDGQGRGHFPFFPNAAYPAFGLAVGALVKRIGSERLERLMQWSVVVGLALVFTAQYFSNLPYSIYQRTNFWTDSPSLILIRGGICLLLMAGSYLWTEYGAGPRWSWMQTMGKNSLMVYWIHVMLVYGDFFKGLKRNLSIGQTTVATVVVTLLMIAMSVAWLWWKDRRAEKWRQATSVAGGQPVKAF